VPATVLLARFQHHYPGLYTSPRYRTTGAVIPFGLFWLYQRRMHVDLALERINQTRAITHALALAFATKGQGRRSSHAPNSVKRTSTEGPTDE
jgi:hypothetical protein